MSRLNFGLIGAGHFGRFHALKLAASTRATLSGIADPEQKRKTIGRVFIEVFDDEAKRIPRHEIEPRPGFEFLIGFPLKFDCGVVEHYIDSHWAIDLFEYVSMAVEMGILTLDEAQGFAQERYFIPGGCELGVYPTIWVRPMLEALESLGRRFVSRNAARIETYNSFQVRAVGFLAERLGSFLLLSELRRRFPAGIPQHLCGYLCAIVPPGGSYREATV